MADDFCLIHDERLGYAPKPGFRGSGAGGWTVTIDADGFRTCGDPPSADAGRVILAVGDSYTFGEEVSDTETWPAQLQRISGCRVLNGGVSGYGFDQIVLRAEALAPVYRPGAIVVAFIADDIRRTEMRRLWSADKPYFDPEGDGLALRNVPVPPRAPAETTLTFWQRTIGYSYAFDFLMRRLDLLHDWFGDHIRVHPAGTGELVSCRLTARLAELQKSSGAPVLLVAAYDPVVWDDPKFAAEQRRLTAGLLDCARRNGLATDALDVGLDETGALAAAPTAAFAPPLRDLVEVRNQARVHLWFEQRFGETYDPLPDTDAALSRFVAPAFAVGVRLEADDTISVAAPFGLEDVFAMTLRPNPLRGVARGWARTVENARGRWPEITVIEPQGPA